MEYAFSRRKIIAISYGVVCHAVFIASVTMMIVCMYSGMQIAWGKFTLPLSIAANCCLMLQFPIVHSFLLTKKGRKLLRFLAPLELGVDLITTTFVIIASLQIFLLFSLWSPSGIIWWQAQNEMRIFMTVLYSASWILVFKSMYDASFSLQTGLLGWWAVWKNQKPVYPEMPKKGLFAFCRQPIYVAFALTLWTVPVWSPDQLFIAIFFTVYCLVGPLLKEKRFARIYGKEFEEYQKTVSYWIPMLTRENKTILNNQNVYFQDAPDWWTGKHRWLRIMQNLVVIRMKFFNQHMTNWQDKQVLDIGCGGGFMAEELAKCGAIVTGLDPAKPAIEIAKEHAKLQNLKINYQIGTAENLPFPEASFDGVMIVDVLEHVEDLEQVIKEIHRVLKPGGYILFDTINRTILAFLIYILFGERLLKIVPLGTHDYKKLIKPRELQDVFRKYQFQLGPTEGIGPIGINHYRDIFFGKWPIKSVIYIGYAKK